MREDDGVREDEVECGPMTSWAWDDAAIVALRGSQSACGAEKARCFHHAGAEDLPLWHHHRELSRCPGSLLGAERGRASHFAKAGLIAPQRGVPATNVYDPIAASQLTDEAGSD